MEKQKLKEMLMSMRTAENDASVNYLLGLIDTISDEDLQSKFKESKVNEENVEDFLAEQIKKVQTQQEQGKQFTNVNQMFCYGRIGDTLHMHLIPKDLRGLKSKLGDEAFYQFFKDQLEDFLSRLQDTFRDDNSIKTLFAVSPIFFNPNIAKAHEDLGFDRIIEIDTENPEDKISVEQKKFFLQMFNKDPKHKTRRVFYTSLPRERLLEAIYARIPEDNQVTLND